MADFWRVLARWLHDSAPTAEERDKIPDELWAAHTHGTGRHRLEKLVSEGTAQWMPTQVDLPTNAWTKVKPEQKPPNINEPENNLYIQSAAEASSALQRKKALARMHPNPMDADPEQY